MDGRGTSVRDIRIICENNVPSIERKVKAALQEGLDYNPNTVSNPPYMQSAS